MNEEEIKKILEENPILAHFSKYITLICILIVYIMYKDNHGEKE